MSSLMVNTNVAALNTVGDLNATGNTMAGLINELSTGLKVQDAATGPAAYMIGQQLQAETNGFTQAMSNAQNGVSLIQTASGALNEISSTLQSMYQLTVTAANGADATSNSLDANAAEFTALVKTVTSIASSTQFGKIKLLTGSFANKTLQIGAFNTAADQVDLTITAVGPGALSLKGGSAKATGTHIIPLTSTKLHFTTTETLTFKITDGSSVTYSVKFAAGTYTPTAVVTKINTVAGKYVTASLTKHTVHTTTTNKTITTYKLVLTTVETGTKVKLKVTANTKFGFNAATSTISGSATGGVSIKTTTNAQKAITKVLDAITKVATIAAKLGAQQDELNAIVSDLTVGQENLSAAEAQVTNATMAQAMTQFTTQSVLEQAGVAMLAQAQAQPQLVLKIV